MENKIQQAVQLLKEGELVAFPTETVYGLGGDAANPSAVQKIFEIKNRPADHPVIVHIYEACQLAYWVKSIPAAAQALMAHFWPGPLTLIFEAEETVSPLITGNQPTIGIRMPSHPVARELLKNFGGALAAPSANRFGKVSPTKAVHVQEELGDKISLVLDGGDCNLGIESTIIDVTCTPPRLLRPGPLNIIQVKNIAATEVVYNAENIPRVSGNLLSHYAPATPLYLIKLLKPSVFQKNSGVIAFHSKPKGFEGIWIKMLLDPISYAHALYAALRKLDAQNLNAIYVEIPPEEIAWEAVRDRLNRAKTASCDQKTQI
jgi:L-threonylcarbamoyladenylate synthase